VRWRDVSLAFLTLYYVLLRFLRLADIRRDCLPDSACRARVLDFYQARQSRRALRVEISYEILRFLRFSVAYKTAARGSGERWRLWADLFGC
jgi:hypothetical protein